jgi:hypothetical protein
VAHSFARWPNLSVPTFGAGVYTTPSGITMVVLFT